MAKTVHFRQYDSRWASKKYPSWGTGTYKYCGCGPTAVATIVSAVNKSVTPKIVGDYISSIKSGATKGGATYWDAIIKSLQKYGFKVTPHSSMTQFFTTMCNGRGNNVRGILDVFGSKGGVTWTKGSGHYIPITDIKKSGSDWLVYVKDPSLRKNDGWYSYNKHLKGHCKLALTCYNASEGGSAPVQTTETITKPDAKYNGNISSTTIKNGSKGSEVKLWQSFLNWYHPAWKLAIDGNFGNATEVATKQFQKTEGLAVDGSVGPKTRVKAESYCDKVSSPSKVKYKAIDVSKHQGTIDFKKVKASGITHVILRSSYTGWSKGTKAKDPKFATYIKDAYNAGLKIGIYHFSQAISIAEGKSEAEYCLKVIEPYKHMITLPVFIDWEFNKRLTSSKAKKLGKNTCTSICKVFCDTVRAHGYKSGIYCNTSTFNSYLYVNTLAVNNAIWCAQYASKCTLGINNLWGWQYSSSGKVNGISTKVDMDYIYVADNPVVTPPPVIEEKPVEQKPIEPVKYSGSLPILEQSKASKLAEVAIKLAHPVGTPRVKYTYPIGSPTAAFKVAIDKAYPDRSGWGKQTRSGASCDVFSGTCIRYSGVDSKMPRGLEQQITYIKKSPNFTEYKGNILQPGDVIVYLNKTSGGHICIYGAQNIICEGGFSTKRFGIANKKSSSYLANQRKSTKWLGVYRPKGTCAIYYKNGDKGEEVKKIQQFLNWAIDAGLTVDGSYGPKTEEAQKKFQTKYGLTADGCFGKASLELAGKITK